jgi:hypothetical protein
VVSYSHYRSLAQRALAFLYENAIVKSYLFVALLIFILLSSVHNVISLILLVGAFGYIFMGVFTSWSEKIEMVSYTRLYFRVFNIIQFVIILVNIVLRTPFVSRHAAKIAKEFGAFISAEQIVLMLFIQLWLDLYASETFEEVVVAHRHTHAVRNEVHLQSLAFQRNNRLVRCLIEQFQEVLSFDTGIAKAMKIIREWHSSTNKPLETLEYDFKEPPMTKHVKLIREEIEEEHIADDHKPFGLLVRHYLEEQTDVSLAHSYYQSLSFVANNINGIIFHERMTLNVWDFLKEDYAIVGDMLGDFTREAAMISNDLIQSDE